LRRAAIALLTLAATLLPAAPAHAAHRHNWRAVALCESGARWHLRYGPGTATGGLQITASTWRAHGGRRYARAAWRATPAQQKRVAERILHTQGRRAWPTCGRRL
jgi:hypothetical protein